MSALDPFSLAVAIIVVGGGRWLLSKYFDFHFSEKIERWFLILMPGRRRNRASIDGIYYSSYWRYTRSSVLKEHTHLVLVRKRSSVFFGEIISGPPNRCFLEGRIDERGFISGTWKNVDANTKYHGTFQFHWLNGMDAIAGKWLGWNAENRINCGIWVLVRITNATGTSSQKEARRDFCTSGDPNGEVFQHQYGEVVKKVIETQGRNDMSLTFADLQRPPAVAGYLKGRNGAEAEEPSSDTYQAERSC